MCPNASAAAVAAAAANALEALPELHVRVIVVAEVLELGGHVNVVVAEGSSGKETASADGPVQKVLSSFPMCTVWRRPMCGSRRPAETHVWVAQGQPRGDRT